MIIKYCIIIYLLKYTKPTFYIPRISGIENNVAVFAHTIHQKNIHDINPLIAYIKKTLPAMKNNAGIKLSQEIVLFIIRIYIYLH